VSVVRDQLDEFAFRTVAPNGVTVLSERLPGLRSVALGIWVRSASVNERRQIMGAAHLLEHMVFKGTERRTAHQIALELEVRGGSLDAYTSRDHTSFQAHVLDTDLALAVDIVTDVIRRPLIRAADLELERNVVLEEIKSVDDTPDDLVFDLHSAALWPDHPYGFQILGTPETVGTLRIDDLKRLHQEGYFPRNCVIAAAGNLDHDSLLEALDREGWFTVNGSGPLPAAVPLVPAVHGVERRVHRDTAQRHIVFGTDTFPSKDPRRFALALLTNTFGGGMSSRLFQRIREDLGLAYAVYSFQQFYRLTGLIGVYVGTRATTAAQAKTAIRAEFALLAEKGLEPAELAGAKQQLKGQLMLALENPASRMHRLAGFILNDDRYRRLDEVLTAIDAVTHGEVCEVAREFFGPDRQTVVELGGATDPDDELDDS
jgi:predicted Zn-dependent peptidase